MSASEAQICNLALIKFGEKTINALTDNTKEGRACKVVYPLMRDEMISLHPWNFAMRRADITGSIVAEPAFGFDYAYQLPAKCLRVWELHDQYTSTTATRVWYSHGQLSKTSPISEEEWEVEGRHLLTNREEDIYIRYIERITETGYFPPPFVNCLALRLAAELAVKLGSPGMRPGLIEELEKVALPQARRLNAFEGRKRRNRDEQPLDEGNYSWQSR